MNDMVKNNLCITCALRQGVDKDGYIKCPYFPTYKKAKEADMNVFIHCFCTNHKDKN